LLRQCVTSFSRFCLVNNDVAGGGWVKVTRSGANWQTSEARRVRPRSVKLIGRVSLPTISDPAVVLSDALPTGPLKVTLRTSSDANRGLGSLAAAGPAKATANATRQRMRICTSIIGRFAAPCAGSVGLREFPNS